MRTTRAFLIIFAVAVAVLMTSCGFILPVKQIWTYTSPSGYIRQLVISSDYIQFIDYYSGDLPLADALIPYSFSEDGTISLTEREILPCNSSGEANYNNYQPVALTEDDPRWERVLSKLDGSFTGPDLTISYEYNFSEY